MKVAFIVLVFVCGGVNLRAQIFLPKVFSNHVVLQRDIEIPVWGKAKPGIEIIAELGNSKQIVRTNEGGEWIVRLPRRSAGGPYKLVVYEANNSKSRVEFSDVVIGDVWLASGQSNMELSVQNARDAKEEIRKADYPMIRFCNVAHAKSLKPEADIQGGTWEVCDSDHVRTTSAVAYYFARLIHAEEGVPVGILHASWGGTPLEAWTSREMLLSSTITRGSVLDNDTLTQAHFVKDSADLTRFWDIVLTPQDSVYNVVTRRGYDDSDWTELDMPKTIGDWGIPHYEGIVWLRKSIQIPADFNGKDLILNLGHPEMNYSLYFNGFEVCKAVWNANLTHCYTIPASVVKVGGENVITVRLAALWGGGGLNPPAEQIYLSDGTARISLCGRWTYKLDLEPRVPKIFNYHYYPTYTYNAMINPLIPFGIRGFLWYQGEANEADAFNYRKLLPMLMADWRIRWQQGYLPFLYVQLPNYMKVQPEPGGSRWAELRESQASTLSQPNTGMACTIDLGDADNIHPVNKQDVGRRLALVAERNVYGKDVVASGPVADGFKVEGNSIRVHFRETGSGLTVKDGAVLEGFAVAGNDETFYWAIARIEGDDVVVSSDKVAEPVAVRYAWADNPVCNLTNKEGLPALPFRTDSWKVLTEE